MENFIGKKSTKYTNQVLKQERIMKIIKMILILKSLKKKYQKNILINFLYLEKII